MNLRKKIIDNRKKFNQLLILMAISIIMGKYKGVGVYCSHNRIKIDEYSEIKN